MRKRVLILVDDSDSADWIDVFEQRIAAEIDAVAVRVDGFGTGDSVAAVETKLKEKHIASGAQFFIVSDSMFGTNPRGGARLLRLLRSAESPARVEWTRAVVYSTAPELDAEAPGELVAVRKQQRPIYEAKRIATFLRTGLHPRHDLEPLRELRGVLSPLLFCCDAFQLAAQRSGTFEGTICKVTSYGTPERKSIAMRPWIGSILPRRDETLVPYSAETAEVFSQEAEMLFCSRYRDAHKLRGCSWYNGNEVRAWRIVVWALHPWKSLIPQQDTGALSPARLLWEIIQTGGEDQLLSQHPSTCADLLPAQQRVWVRQHLEVFAQQMRSSAGDSNLPMLAARVLLQMEELDEILRLVAEGENWEHDDDL